MKTNVPFKVYATIASVSIAVLVVFAILEGMLGELWLADMLVGLGAGGISSTVVALIDDFVNTKTTIQKEEKIYLRLISGLKMACNDLLSEFVIAAQVAYPIDLQKRTFDHWVSMLLKDDIADPRILNEADYALQQIAEIRRQSEILLQDSKIHLDNRNIDDIFIGKIKQIQNICQRIDREHKRKKYGICRQLILEKLVDALCAFDPNLRQDFEKPFNWEEE